MFIEFMWSRIMDHNTSHLAPSSSLWALTSLLPIMTCWISRNSPHSTKPALRKAQGPGGDKGNKRNWLSHYNLNVPGALRGKSVIVCDLMDLLPWENLIAGTWLSYIPMFVVTCYPLLWILKQCANSTLFHWNGGYCLMQIILTIALLSRILLYQYYDKKRGIWSNIASCMIKLPRSNPG